MSERFTDIRVPGVFGSGLADYGRKTPQEMIRQIREYALTQKQLYDIILLTKDEDFQVETYIGSLAHNNKEVLQEGRKWQK